MAVEAEEPNIGTQTNGDACEKEDDLEEKKFELEVRLPFSWTDIGSSCRVSLVV